MAKVMIGDMEVQGLDVEIGSAGLGEVRLHGKPVVLGEVQIRLLPGHMPECKVMGFLPVKALVAPKAVAAKNPRKARVP